jgi:hypothetical protein
VRWIWWSMTVLLTIALILGGAGIVVGIAKRDVDWVRRLTKAAAKTTTAAFVLDFFLSTSSTIVLLRQVSRQVSTAHKAMILSAAISEGIQLHGFRDPRLLASGPARPGLLDCRASVESPSISGVIATPARAAVGAKTTSGALSRSSDRESGKSDEIHPRHRIFGMPAAATWIRGRSARVGGRGRTGVR